LKEFKAKSVGAGTKFLKIGMIQNFQLALPSIDQQKTIVSKLDKLAELRNQLENIYLNKIEDFEELKKSILQKAFSGDLIRRAS
jgi:type I restriction enzyme S subunit